MVHKKTKPTKKPEIADGMSPWGVPFAAGAIHFRAQPLSGSTKETFCPSQVGLGCFLAHEVEVPILRPSVKTPAFDSVSSSLLEKETLNMDQSDSQNSDRPKQRALIC